MSSSSIILASFTCLRTAAQGVYGSNFNETIFFCNQRPYTFELNQWNIIPVIAKSWDSGQSSFNPRGTVGAARAHSHATALHQPAAECSRSHKQHNATAWQVAYGQGMSWHC
jgi:hypothetical protein